MQDRIKYDQGIGIFDGFILKEDCKKVIDFFEKENKINNTFSRLESEGASGLSKKDEQYFALTETFDVWNPIFKTIILNLKTVIKLYADRYAINNLIPLMKLGSNKIQKTKPGGGYHVWHTEHAGSSLDQMSRSLVYTIYLNDIEEGGETEFLHQSVRCSAKEGRICIFPAGIPYLHRGNPPLKENKYIITSWIEYKYNNNEI